MTLHQLRLFVAAAERGNITKAAYDLHISQPAVSRQLKLLQEERGMELYKVHGQGIELTNEGRILLKKVKPLLVEFDGLENPASRKGEKAETFAIGGSHTPAASFLLSLIALFRKMHPKVQIILRSGSSQAIEQMIVNSEVEVGFITATSDLPVVSYETCHEDKVVVFASAKHPLGRRQRLTLKAFAAAPLIVERGPSGQAGLLKCLAKHDLKPNIVMECEHPQLVIAAVKNCIGLGMLYREAIKSELSEGKLKILAIHGFDLRERNFVAYKKGTVLSSHVNEFLDLVNKRLTRPRYRPSSLEAA